ncbi:MAG: hypothetical protein JO184_11370 [Gammaproteobacteria bacterium]|nr:hypothetical protein [Gammaproteobacteria bacterium]
MPDETNQDPQKPTQDQVPPKQYATPRPGESGERGTDERTPKIPDHIESSEGDDEDRVASNQGARYDEDSSVKGSTGRSGSDKRSMPPGQSSHGAESPKPGTGADTKQNPGSGSRQTPGSSGGGSSAGSGTPTGGQKGR